MEKTLCTAQLDGITHESEEFVAVLAKEDGDASIVYNADVLTLAIASRLISNALVDSINQLTAEEKDDFGPTILAILGDSSSTEEGE